MDNRLISVGENVTTVTDIKLMKEMEDKYGWNGDYKKYITSFLKENHGKTLKVLKQYNSKLILDNGKDKYVVQSEMVNPIRKNADFLVSIDTEACSIVLTQEFVGKKVPQSFALYLENGFAIKRSCDLELCSDCVFIRGGGSSSILHERRFENFNKLDEYLENLRNAFFYLNSHNFGE